jgi:hypothetical protein
MFRHVCPLAVKPASTTWRLLPKQTWRDSLLTDMLLLCLPWLLSCRVRKSRRDLWITLCTHVVFWEHSVTGMQQGARRRPQNCYKSRVSQLASHLPLWQATLNVPYAEELHEAKRGSFENEISYKKSYLSWYITHCSALEIHRRFGITFRLHLHNRRCKKLQPFHAINSPYFLVTATA